MLSLVLLMAATDPDLVSLRAEASLAAWSMCVDHQMEKTQASLVGPKANRATLVELAMSQCYVFGQDYKRTLPDVAVGILADQGVKHYSPGVVDSIADEAFRQREEQLRNSKVAP